MAQDIEPLDKDRSLLDDIRADISVGGIPTESGAQLYAAARLTLLAMLIATGSLGVMVLREDIAMKRLIKARSPMVEQSALQGQAVLRFVGELRLLGQQFPGYSNSVLSSFDLSSVSMPTNSVAKPSR